jgi:L-arabinose isomerase
MNPAKVGLLPLYVKLYDDVLPTLAAQLEPFLQQVQATLGAGGGPVLAAPVARTRPDVAAAVAAFETAGVDAIVTLHLAYSPSLESAEVLARTPLSVILLSTTPDHDFGGHVDPMRLLFNHGVHGVQDLAAVLRRMGKPCRVVAGHLSDATLLHRYRDALRGAHAARCLRTMRALRVGGMFPGMGDFAVDDRVLQRALGVAVEQIEPVQLAAAVNAVSDAAAATELAADRSRFRINCDEAVHLRSIRVGLGLRDYLQQGGFGAFSVNFLAFQDAAGPVNTVPFLECCKALARGVGYAGEGDVLTAALVGALAQGIGPTTFTEIFCPDWAGQSLFLSHMGECNPAVAAAQPLLYEKPYRFTAALNPATLACAPQPGPAMLVNLSPGPHDRFRLITAAVEVLPDGTHPDLDRWVRGWVRPQVPLVRFLEEFSQLGGTHHSALLYGDHAAALEAMSAFLTLEHCAIA